MSDVLAWSLSDPEQRLGFTGGRYTRVNYLFSGLVACLLTATVYGALYPLRDFPIGQSFYREGSLPISVAIVFFTMWSLVVLALKSMKLRLQRKALEINIVPDEPDFSLSPNNVEEIQDRIHRSVDDSKYFVLFHRIQFALSNLRNLGRVGDLAEIFKTEAEYDEASMETSYLLLSAFVWAIPVLGFIGTVLGLSSAIGEFGNVLQSASELSEIKENLKSVTGGLSTAFETTLQGLLAALVVQLRCVWQKKAEQEFMDDCNEYCSRNIVSRLRLLPLDQAEDR